MVENHTIRAGGRTAIRLADLPADQAVRRGTLPGRHSHPADSLSLSRKNQLPGIPFFPRKNCKTCKTVKSAPGCLNPVAFRKSAEKL